MSPRYFRLSAGLALVTMLAACQPEAAEVPVVAAAPPVDGAAAAAAPAAAPAAAAPAKASFTLGCTSSVYDSGSGTYQFQPKGYVDIAGGSYTYRGFEQPSTGKLRDEGGTLHFEGGWLDGGEAVPMDDRPGQYRLTSPAAGERWSCKQTD